jgi:hypothetical protein
VDYANLRPILFGYFIGNGLEAGDRSYAAILDLYFHCKKSNASIWQLSTGLAHFGTSRRSPRMNVA